MAYQQLLQMAYTWDAHRRLPGSSKGNRQKETQEVTLGKAKDRYWVGTEEEAEKRWQVRAPKEMGAGVLGPGLLQR